jgi:Flp pilus assembly protein TadG
MIEKLARRMRARGSQRGTVAIIAALAAVVIFGLAAGAVDLGNAYQRRAEVQQQVDLAALSSADKLPADTATNKTTIQNAVLCYLGDPAGKLPGYPNCSKLNKKYGQDQVFKLTDGDYSNGEIVYDATNPYKMTVYGPSATVNFALAGIVGAHQTKVRARATVAMGSPGAAAEMPFFAVQSNSCDYGSHLLSQPANGQLETATLPADLQVPSVDPTLVNDHLKLTTVTPSVIALNAAAATVSLTGQKLSSVNRVAFLRSVQETPNRFEVTSANFGAASNGGITNIQIPAAMTAQPGVWWIRVYKPVNNESGNKQAGWSALSQAIPLQIGEGYFDCDGSNSGNFGSLLIPRTDVSNSTSNGWLPNNIAHGLQRPLSLAVLAGASIANPYCVPGATGVVYSPGTGNPSSSDLHPRTNCVDTDTGLTATSATSGLVTGTPLFSGRLAKPTSTGVLQGGARNGDCGPGHSSSTRTVAGVPINNDVLSCFMVSPTMPLSTIATASYNGGPALDPAIYNSPRFCYVPVIGVKASNGGSQHYGIVDIRPCFITGETVTSTYNSQSMIDGTDNGLTVPVSKVTAIRVIFFNSNALPAQGAMGDYIGVGPKVVALVD